MFDITTFLLLWTVAGNSSGCNFLFGLHLLIGFWPLLLFFGNFLFCPYYFFCFHKYKKNIFTTMRFVSAGQSINAHILSGRYSHKITNAEVGEGEIKREFCEKSKSAGRSSTAARLFTSPRANPVRLYEGRG